MVLSFPILHVTYLKKLQNIFIYMETTSKLSFSEIDFTIFITTERNWQKQPLAHVFSLNFALKTLFLQNISGGYFWTDDSHDFIMNNLLLILNLEISHL